MPVHDRAPARRPRHAIARYRILARPFAQAIARRFTGLAQRDVATRLGISRPTLRRLLRADGTVNLATVERLERVLREPRLGFATAAVDPARDILPALTDRPAGRVDALLHSLGKNPLLAAFFAQVGRHVHWQAHIDDRARPYRQEVRLGAAWPATGGYARFAVEAAERPAELALSFSLAGADGFALAIDYGLLRIDDEHVHAWELIARRSTVAPAPPGEVSFLTWLPGHDAVLVVRSDRPCRIRHVATLTTADGDARLDEPAAEAGFRAMGYFHVAPDAPWR